MNFTGRDCSRLSVSRWWFGRSLLVNGPVAGRYRGVKSQDVAAIRSAIAGRLQSVELGPVLDRARAFRSDFNRLLEQHRMQGRWIPYDRVAAVLRLRPTDDELALLRGSMREALLTPEEREALDLLGRDWTAIVRSVNAQILSAELASRRDFFDRIEKSPLTEEQARAVVTFDNRVRVVAAAGSGKTSVMVARAAYAVARGFVAPERILMLAFNTDAAAELRARVAARLEAVGLPTAGIQASTFHSFGLALIGRATGRKPSVASWVGRQSTEIDKVLAIVDELRDSSPEFRYKWDTFRLLYGRMSETPETGDHDSYDRDTRQNGFRTYRGETVRSEGERLIADWLFLNGVEYRYEQPYAHDVADADHSQYRPDFYYPQIDVWHEHWALRADGTPPEAFTGYADSMQWKRSVHQRFGTTLLETAWHEIVTFKGFAALDAELRTRGVELDWNPERPRPTSGAQPIEHERLARTIRTFMSNVKANSLTRDDLAARLAERPSPRTRIFLELYWEIHDRWEQELRAAGAIDFDDMLVQAADLLERSPDLSAYDLVLIDEFQDTSHSRARLVRALCQGPEKYLLAVGDDWQAINRFAGADITAMTRFEQMFGPAETVRLQTTFRNPQTIADIAGRFVSRNPAQIDKRVVSARRAASHPEDGPPVTIIRVETRDGLQRAIDGYLTDLATRAAQSSIDVLGRYRHEEKLVPRHGFPGLDVTFRTVHAAKGLEADYVILPNLTKGIYGFPSKIEDDPVLGLAMPGDDGFPHAEERRLFYVALTRARRAVTIFTVVGQESPFVVELLDDPDVVVQGITPNATRVRVCPGCGQGTLVLRRGPYGEFLGCSRYPACTHKAKLDRGTDSGRLRAASPRMP
ncbi:UvrD-helicase domain-containing protein [Raineyella antarctica]|nr:UvrD-helicase domain-containing protein [Raineyella antarctica]